MKLLRNLILGRKHYKKYEIKFCEGTICIGGFTLHCVMLCNDSIECEHIFLGLIIYNLLMDSYRSALHRFSDCD